MKSISAKLFFGIALVMGVCLLIAVAGHQGIYRLNQEIHVMYAQRLIPVADIVGIKADLMEARAALMALIHEKDPQKQHQLHDNIGSVSGHLDQTLAYYEKSALISEAHKEKLAEFKKTWEAFKNTRENELIPFILKGNADNAVALATGIQAERLAKMSGSVDAIIRSVKEEAFQGRKNALVMSASLVKIYWAISLIGIVVTIFLNLGLTLRITTRLKRVVASANKLAKGDLSERLEVDSRDEVGQMSEALNQAFEKMSQLIKALEKSAADLKNSQDQLVQSAKMSAVGQLAAGVAHEINNPLGIILGFAQGAARRIQPNDPLELPIKSIERESMRCKQLVQDLLTFSRAGKTEKEEMDINAMISSSLPLIMAQAKVKNIRLVRELEPGLPRIFANPGQIQQILVNLSNNAMDAMPEAGTLTVRTKRALRGGKDAVELQVQDTGLGIPKEVQSRIYEPFFTTKEIGKGTGLGLSLVFEIIQKHRGHIELDSDVGKGALFKIYLPTKEREVLDRPAS